MFQKFFQALINFRVTSFTQQDFVELVLETVELKKIRDELVGIPNISGLSTEQRKRLTIAVELVANPSIIFMDEPTSGLDAREAAIVMRAVKSIVNMGRTAVCTIHQPSIDIFESFDEVIQIFFREKNLYWHEKYPFLHGTITSWYQLLLKSTV